MALISKVDLPPDDIASIAEFLASDASIAVPEKLSALSAFALDCLMSRSGPGIGRVVMGVFVPFTEADDYVPDGNIRVGRYVTPDGTRASHADFLYENDEAGNERRIPGRVDELFAEGASVYYKGVPL